jgi:hypothetical protein
VPSFEIAPGSPGRTATGKQAGGGGDAKNSGDWLFHSVLSFFLRIYIRFLFGASAERISKAQREIKHFADFLLQFPQASQSFTKHAVRACEHFDSRFRRAGVLRVHGAEDVQTGHIDLYSKGGKLRRLYIPKRIKEETLA